MPVDYTAIQDHVTRALNHVLSQFSAATNLRRLVSIFAAEVQELEDVTSQCVMDRMLTTAVGVQLDQYGKVVGQPRDGLTDDEYRLVITARIQVNKSNGTIDPITSVLSLLTGGAFPVRYSRLGVASYQLEYTVAVALSAVMLPIVLDMMADMRPAGVELSHVSETVATEGWFGFDADPGALGFDAGKFVTEVHTV